MNALDRSTLPEASSSAIAVSGRAGVRPSRLTPMPTIAASSRLPWLCVSTSTPASLSRADEDVVGPLERGRRAGARAASHAPMPIASVSGGTSASGSGGRSTADSRARAGRRAHARPSRPRPARLRSRDHDRAVRARRRARARAASSFVERTRRDRCESQPSQRSLSPDVEPDVDGGRRVRERADRDQVRAGARVVGDRRERDAARDLDEHVPRPCARAAATSTCAGVMLSSSTTSAPAASASSSSPRFVTSTSTRSGCGAFALRGLDRGAHRAARGDVVVLDQDARAEVEAMVRAAAGEHRRLLEHAEAGRGLARVDDARLACRRRRSA